MPIVGKTRDSASFRRNRRLLTGVLLLYLVYTFTPLLYLVTAATKTNPDLFTTFGLWFSRDFHLFENLHDLFANGDGIFRRWLWNSFYYAAFSAIGSALVATLAGYAFSKYDFLGKRPLYALVLGAVMIPQTALVIPLFLLLSEVGLLNTSWAVILPSLVFPIGVFLMRAYIDGISDDIIDAGRMDGAGEIYIFVFLVFRLIMPAFTTVLVLAFVGELEQLLPAARRAQLLGALPGHRWARAMVCRGDCRQRRRGALHRGCGGVARLDHPGDHRLSARPALLAGRSVGRIGEIAPQPAPSRSAIGWRLLRAAAGPTLARRSSGLWEPA